MDLAKLDPAIFEGVRLHGTYHSAHHYACVRLREALSPNGPLPGEAVHVRIFELVRAGRLTYVNGLLTLPLAPEHLACRRRTPDETYAVGQAELKRGLL